MNTRTGLLGGFWAGDFFGALAFLGACFIGGVMCTKGKSVKTDEAKAVEVDRKACDGGNTSGCLNTGVRYEEGRGVQKDEAKAVELYRKACEGGEQKGCTLAGLK